MFFFVSHQPVPKPYENDHEDKCVAQFQKYWSESKELGRHSHSKIAFCSPSEYFLDQESGHWVYICGCWYHGNGFGSAQPELLLRMLVEDGVERALDGMQGYFFLILGHRSEPSITLATDLIGSCHVYLANKQREVFISSSSLFLAASQNSEYCPLGFQEFLQTGVIYERRTLFNSIEKLAPATIFEFKPDAQGSLIRTERKYWNITSLEPNSLKGEKAVDLLYEGILQSARAVQEISTRLTCDLTGGYDSRALLSGFLHSKADFVATVTGLEADGDVQSAKAIARKFNLDLKHFLRPFISDLKTIEIAVMYCDGECDAVEYAGTHALHTEMSRSFDVSVNGSFGEVARGYWWELLWPNVGQVVPINAEKIASGRYVLNNFDKSLCSIDLLGHFRDMFQAASQEIAHFPNTTQMDMLYLRFRMQRWQGRIASSTSRIRPCLSPFMLRPLLETMLQMDWRVRRHGYVVKRMFEKYHPELGSIALEHGWPALPFRYKSALSYLPWLFYWAGKVGRKLSEKTSILQGPTSGRLGSSTQQILWNDPKVREEIFGQDLFAEKLVDPTILKIFLKSSQAAGFVYGAQWNRLLTFEIAQRKIHQLREKT